MDSNGFLNRKGLWNRTGLLLAVLFAAAVIIPQHLFFLEGLLVALVFFTAVWLPLLLAAFLLAVLAVSVQHLAARFAHGRTATVAFSLHAFALRSWRALVDWFRTPVRPAFPRIAVLKSVRVATLLELPRRVQGPRRPEHHRAA